MGSAQGALDVFRSWLAQGIHEIPAGSNFTPIGREFGWNGVAWCAEAVSVALARSGTPGYHTASVYVFRDQLKREGRWLGSTPQVGACAIYSSSAYPNGGAHINLVEAITGSTMVCIGGNEGDAVRRSIRTISSAYGFGMPKYTSVTPPTPIPVPSPTPTPVPSPVLLPSPKGAHDMFMIATNEATPKYFLVGPNVFTGILDSTYLKLASNGLPHAEGVHPLEAIALSRAVGKSIV